MGGSSSQVVGYRYYAKFTAFIGNRIEKLIAINFDNRGWIVKDKDDASPYLEIIKPSLYGENEGGVAGIIDIEVGTPDQEPNKTYQKYFPLVSGYPYQSYLVFRGLGAVKPNGSLIGGVVSALQAYRHDSFYLGNSGYMKEMLLWVKRIHVKNNGDGQWYDIKSEINTVSDFVAVDKSTIGKAVTSESYRSYKFSDSLRDESQSTIESTVVPIGEIAFSGHAGALRSGTINSDVSFEASVTLNPSQELTGIINVEIPIKVNALHFSWGFVGDLFDVEFIPLNDRELDGSYIVKGKIKSSKPLTANLRMRGIVQHTGNDYLGGTIGIVYKDIDSGFEKSLENPDINPIHKIREILTDDVAMSKPESDVNDINFMKAADRIWDEGLGISWAIDEKSCIEAIEELCYHIEAGIRVNRQTGLYEMVLFRDDWFSEDEIHTITENKIKDLSLEVMNSDDIVNQLNVTYYDRERIKNSTFSIYENGSILTMGKANAESIEFPYFMNMRNSEIVANWKLKQFSTPAWSGSFTTGWKEAHKWNRYDLIRLPWSKKWNGSILVRIMKINLGNGTDNTVTIDFEEVIPYSGEMNTSIVVDESMNEGVQPPQPSINVVFEAPYYLTVLRTGQTNADLELSNNPDIGYVAAIAAKPQSNSLNALLYTDGGVGDFEQVSRLDYCDILQLDQPIVETTSSFSVTGSLTQTANSNNLILLNGELMGFVSFDTETKVLTVKRGVLDTVPKKHSSGFLFVFDLPDVSFDSTQYAQSEIIEAQVLTTTPSGIQELSETGTAVEIQSRAIRPYPPANVKINSVFMPLYIEGGVQITWANRNRLQQTGGEMIGYFEGSVVLEPNTQTLLTVTELDVDDIELATHSINATGTNTFVLEEAYMQIGVRALHINLKTVRDGYDCINAFDHTVRISNLIAPQNVTFEVIEL